MGESEFDLTKKKKGKICENHSSSSPKFHSPLLDCDPCRPMRVELMAAESSNNRGKKESTASGLLSSPRLNDDVEDPVKSPPLSPNNSSTRKVNCSLFCSLLRFVAAKFVIGNSSFTVSLLYVVWLLLLFFLELD